MLLPKNIFLATIILGTFTLSLELPAIATQTTLAQATESRKVEAGKLIAEGNELFNAKEFAKALPLYLQAIAIYQQIGDRAAEGNTATIIGNVYYNLENYIQSINCQQSALNIALKIKNEDLEARALNNLGNGYQALKETERAIDYYQKSLVIRQKLKDYVGEEITLKNLINAYREIKSYAQSIPYYQQLIALVREIKDLGQEARILNYLGYTYLDLRENMNALKSFEQGLNIAQVVANQEEQWNALNGLGNLYFTQEDYEQALNAYQQSLVIAQSIKNRSLETTSLENIGGLYYSLHQYLPAIAAFEQSIKIARELEDAELQGSSLRKLGNIYHDLGDYEQAIAFHLQSLKIAREINHQEDISYALGELGLDYRQIDQYSQATEYFQQQLAIAKKINNYRSELAALINLGTIYNIVDDYPRAKETLEQSLILARQKSDRYSEGIALGELGLLANQLKNYPQAINYYQQRITIAQAIGDRIGEAKGLSNLGNTFLSFNQPLAAEKSLNTSVKIWESLRTGLSDRHQISIFNMQSLTYIFLQKALIAQNKINRALEIAERGRARAFVNLLAEHLNQNKLNQSPIDPPNIAQIKQIAKEQNATIVQYSIMLNDFKSEGQETTEESDLYIWAIKPTGEVNFRQADLRSLRQKKLTLADLVNTSRDAMGVSGRGSIQVSYIGEGNEEEKLQQLYQLLIAPIADLLPTNPEGRVIFIPQKSLFVVPFAALKDPTGKYLIEKHTVLTAPSIQVLDLTRKQRQKQLAANVPSYPLVVGNPTMPKIIFKIGEPAEQLPDLPGAKQEALAIADLLKTTAFTGSAATKTTIVEQLSQAKIIHLATHGLLDDFKGLGVPGAIALAPDAQDSGLLTANEILDLKLNAELVVLSACDTGRGRITGDGVIGLSRSLIAAGASSIIVSLWSVPDAPTAALMVEFYRQLQQNPDKAQALRQAMLATMKKHPQPRDWAAFTLIGEAE